MVANQPMRCTTSSGLQPIAASATRAARTACGLRTADLLRPSAAEQGLDLTGAGRLGRHENAELVVREAWIVGDRAEPVGGGWKMAVSGFASFTTPSPFRAAARAAPLSPRRSTPSGSSSRTTGTT